MTHIFNDMDSDQKLEALNEKISRISEDISEMRKDIKAIQDPREGIYSELRNIRHDVDHHKKRFESLDKVYWLLASLGITGLVGALVKVILLIV